MNILFGIWRPNGPPVIESELEAMAAHTARFAQDGKWLRTTSEIGFGVQAQYTHARSELGARPVSNGLQNVVAFDGRLDNFREIQALLKIDATLSDSEIVLTAYSHWGCDCFAKLIGDWALALWDATLKALFLARDHAGARTLYYSCDSRRCITWSTYLDGFINTPHLTSLSENYLASYLAMVPTYTHSPYEQIFAVPPGHFLRVTLSHMEARQHWTPMISDQLHYAAEDDYVEQFTYLFRQAVERRIGDGYPAIAELSGGMDSTSIVCVADAIVKSEGYGRGLLDTLSYFDNKDPDWNELPFINHVEEMRGKEGIHIDLSPDYVPELQSPTLSVNRLLPGNDLNSERRGVELFDRLAPCGYRTILSGMGGDEMTGGMPDPLPEIADKLCAGRVLSSLRSAVAFCMASRTSLAEMSLQLVRFISSASRRSGPQHISQSIPWLTYRARNLAQASMQELPLVRYRPFLNRPSASASCIGWWLMLRTLPHLRPVSVYRLEYRYPFLDRDLVDFLLRVPPQQLVKPGRRRSLMRRALRDVVPEKILERRRKAYRMQPDLQHIRYLSQQFEALLHTSVLADKGLLIREPLQAALQEAVTGSNLRWLPLVLRTMRLESWLRSRIDCKSTSALVQDSVTNGPKIAFTDKRHAMAGSSVAVLEREHSTKEKSPCVTQNHPLST